MLFKALKKKIGVNYLQEFRPYFTENKQLLHYEDPLKLLREMKGVLLYSHSQKIMPVALDEDDYFQIKEIAYIIILQSCGIL